MPGAMTEERKRKQSETMKAKWAARKAAAAAAQGGEPKHDPRPEPPKQDKGKAKSKRTHGKDPGDGELERVIARIFTLPAVPMKMIVGCDFCTMHFTVEGPNTARELVELSKQHPQLRGVLLDLYRSYTNVTWIGIVAGYLVRPLAHHMAPNGFLEYSYPVLGVPPRAAPPPPRERAPNGGPPGSPPTEEEPLHPLHDHPDYAQAMASAQQAMAGMTDQQLADLAEQMGLDVSAIIPQDAPADQSPQDPTVPADPPGAAGPDPQPGE